MFAFKLAAFKVVRTSTTASNATYYTPSNKNNPIGTREQSIEEQNNQQVAGINQREHVSLRPQASTTISDTESSGFSFLDPRRRQEVQTRESYIA